MDVLRSNTKGWEGKKLREKEKMNVAKRGKGKAVEQREHGIVLEE